MSATTMASGQVHFLSTCDAKLIVIRGYLQKNFAHGIIQEVSQPGGELKFTVTCGGVSRCTVRVSSALLSDQHLTSIELRWALKERDIARKLLSDDCIDLNHETLRAGDMGAIARWPRQMKSYGHESARPGLPSVENWFQ
ncbi:MAG: hypothetical protein ABI618_08955 [Nitrospirota bacterium]